VLSERGSGLGRCVKLSTSEVDYGNADEEFVCLVRQSLTSPFSSSIFFFVNFMKETSEGEMTLSDLC